MYTFCNVYLEIGGASFTNSVKRRQSAHEKRGSIKADAIYNILCRIPSGKVTTYGDIAKALGCPGASRAVGRILNKNPNPIAVPCHRVIMSDGSIGGYALGKVRKKELLAKEGLSFEGDSLKDFAERRLAIEK